MTILVSHNAHDIIIARTITTQSRHKERQTNETDTDNKGISVFMILVRVLPLHASFAEVPRSDWHMLILYSCDLWGMTLSLVKRPAWCHSTGMLVWRHMEAGLVSDTAGVSGIVVLRFLVQRQCHILQACNFNLHNQLIYFLHDYFDRVQLRHSTRHGAIAKRH